MATDNRSQLSAPMPATVSGSSARRRILSAFNTMVLERIRRPFPVLEIIHRAGVARSTFYENFGNEEALSLAAITPPLTIIADALTERQTNERLVGLLTHFWDYRAQARAMLCGPRRDRLDLLLCELFEDRLTSGAFPAGPDKTISAIQLSAATLKPIECWVTGRISTSPQLLANRLVATADAILGIKEKSGN